MATEESSPKGFRFVAPAIDRGAVEQQLAGCGCGCSCGGEMGGGGGGGTGVVEVQEG
jgi:hypothetical protein